MLLHADSEDSDQAGLKELFTSYIPKTISILTTIAILETEPVL